MKSKLIKKGFIAAVAWLSLYGPASAPAAPAPGGPGAPAVWAPAQKSFLGTSASDTSQVYFTGYRGILTEVFYPVLDTPNVQDSQFLVGDSDGTWVDEEKLQAYRSTQPDDRAMLWQVQTWHNAHHWRLTKRLFSDPARHTLIQRVTWLCCVNSLRAWLCYPDEALGGQ
jgi:glucoamylase